MKDTELEEVGLSIVEKMRKGFNLIDVMSEMLTTNTGVLPDVVKRVGLLFVENLRLRGENAELTARIEAYKLEISRLQRLSIKDKIELNRLKGDNKPADITAVLIKKKK